MVQQGLRLVLSALSPSLVECRMSKVTQIPRLYRVREVSEIVGLSVRTIWLKVADKTFPAPMKIGKRAVAWREGDLQAWADGLQVKDAA
ncbi:helix-turn-helix transcriptional regulator [Oceanibaculum nanhaiense]|uniref:helix-turn-helix transcriptional regulator n=1 Tax=Oceanibaculum nanhaiense TaxID=1909734 RepID=UPI003D2E9CFE